MLRGAAAIARKALAVVAVLAAATVFRAVPALGQDPEPSSPVRSILKQVVSDATTYAPSAFAGTAQYLDWKSSQVFFQHGSLEENPDFTVSGLSGDTPVSYGTGNWRIARSAVTNLGPSIANNAAAAIVERVLIKRYPTHRKLVRALSWVERIAFASYASYNQSAASFRQWELNNERAKQLGY
jgi:hypothetical protein